jgi:paraquat-inducible protein A
MRRMPGPLLHMTTALAPRERIVCFECDATYARRAVGKDDVLRCRRCGATLARGHGLAADGQLGLALGALLTFLIGSLSPIVTLELSGVHSVATLYEATRDTWRAGEHGVALLSVATAFVFPLLVILLRLWVLVPMLRGRRAWMLARVLRVLRWVTRWSMVEVFMLGVLIAVVRSAGITHVVLGPGIFAYGVLTVLLTAIQASGLDALWAQLDERAA